MNEHPLDDTQSHNSCGNNPFANRESGDSNSSFVDQELADVFDRYAAALDSGDHQAAEAVLANYPEIGDEFRGPLRGLYLLGKAAQHRDLGAPSSGELGFCKPNSGDTHHERTHEGNGTRRLLGDFEIEYELGRGGMGIVYAATQCSLQRHVALKVLPFTSVLDPRQVARFRNEAQAAASLHHANIVPVYGVGCHRGVHYYSMQLIDGQSLEKFIADFKLPTRHDNENVDETSNETSDGIAKPTSKRTSEPVAAGALSTVVSFQTINYVRSVIGIAVDAARAVHHAHENGIVHRDIKPSNLLLDQTGHIWVADFGLARCTGNANLTSQGDRLGTARYMSPEQSSGRTNQIDFRTDIYSLGATMYELLALQPAFSATDRMQLMAAIDSKTPPGLRTINPAIPIDLETVVNKAMEKLPSDRYQSADEFANDLARCLEGKPILARRQTLLDRTAKSLVRHKKFATIAVAGLIAIAATASFVATVFYNQHHRERIAGDKARFFLQQAHSTVERFSALASNDLGQLPGTGALQARLLGESIDYYQDFLEFADHSPDLLFQRAQARSRLAGLQETAGENTAAQSNFETSIRLFEEHSDRDLSGQQAFDCRIQQAIAWDRIGLLNKRQGRYQEAESNFELSLTTFRELETTCGSDHEQGQELAAAHAQTLANVAMLSWLQGDSETATNYFQCSLALVQPESDSNFASPDRDASRSAYYKINGNFVSMLQRIDRVRAEAILRTTIASLERINDQVQARQTDNPNNRLIIDNSRHIADLQNNLAIVLRQRNETGDLQEAKTIAEQAIVFWKSQHEQSPRNLNYANRLANCWNTCGEIVWSLEEDGLGDAAFAKAEKLLRAITVQSTDQPDSLSSLAGVLHNRSLVAERYGDTDVAIRLIKNAIKFQTGAIELVPDSAEFSKRLSAHKHVLSGFTLAKINEPKSSAQESSDPKFAAPELAIARQSNAPTVRTKSKSK